MTMMVPELDPAGQLELLQFHFCARWRVERADGAWIATGRLPGDEHVKLIADSAGELALAMMWTQMQADLRRAITA